MKATLADRVHAAVSAASRDLCFTAYRKTLSGVRDRVHNIVLVRLRVQVTRET